MKRFFTSCFGLGLLPVAPGTWGSLPSAVVFGFLAQFKADALTIVTVLTALIGLGSFVCIKFSPAVAAMTGKKDPGEIVADEMAGQAVTFLAFPFASMAGCSAGQAWLVAAGGFILFRIFDITKPWPIKSIEKLPGGWGILLDDLLAGVYAAAVLITCFWLTKS
jgi:phosphatidylglycerophosphatase A